MLEIHFLLSGMYESESNSTEFYTPRTALLSYLIYSGVIPAYIKIYVDSVGSLYT